MNHDLGTSKGVLMEEAGDEVEFLLARVRIQHYGPEYLKFMIDEIATRFNKGYHIIPLDYLKNSFQENTYINIKNHLSIKISVKQLRKTTVLHEELLKFNLKRVFNPNDEPTSKVATTDTWIQIGKHVFDPHNKNY